MKVNGRTVKSVELTTDGIRVEFEPEKKAWTPKDGDFVFHKWAFMVGSSAENVFIFKSMDSNHINFYARECIKMRDCIYNPLSFDDFINRSDEVIFRLANPQESQLLLDALKKAGKKWNPTEKRIENINYTPRDGDFVEWPTGQVGIYHKKETAGRSVYHFFLCNVEPCFDKSIRCGNNEIRPASTASEQKIVEVLAANGKKWNSEKKQIENVRWRAGGGEAYYSIKECDGMIIIGGYTERFSSEDNYRFSSGNYYPSAFAASAALSKINQIFTQNI